MRKQHWILFLAIAALAAPAFANVVGSKHDLSSTGTATGNSTNITEVCVFCHTPHQAAGANAQDPLWNHTIAGTAAYTVYASDTLDATPTELGGATAGTAAVSNLCMSCHDGSVGLGSLYNAPAEGTPSNSAVNITGAALMGTDLSNDHPINFNYNAALQGLDNELVIPDSADFVDAAGEVPLFNESLQCATCHDPHDTTNAPFLVKSNTNSGLCTTCHVK